MDRSNITIADPLIKVKPGTTSGGGTGAGSHSRLHAMDSALDHNGVIAADYGKIPKANISTGVWGLVVPVESYLALTDTDDTVYTSKVGFVPTVNGTADGLVLANPAHEHEGWELEVRQGTDLIVGMTIAEADVLKVVAGTNITFEASMAGPLIDGYIINSTASGVSTYIDLTDTDDADYTGKVGYVATVNATADGLILAELPASASSYIDLTDTSDTNYTGKNEYVPMVDETNSELDLTETIEPTFLMLTDTPSTYSGQGGKTVKVNSGATALEFTTSVTAYTHPNHSGDVTSVADGATTIAADAVTNAKMANMAANTIKGNNTAGSENPVDMTVAQLITMLGWIEDISFEFRDITAGTAQTYDLDIKASYGYTIESASLETDNGTLTGVAVKIGSTAVTSLSSVTVDTVVDTTDSTGAKTVAAGDRITLVTSTGYTGTPTLIRGKIKIKRT